MDVVANLEAYRKDKQVNNTYAIRKVGIDEEAKVVKAAEKWGEQSNWTKHAIMRSVLHNRCFVAEKDGVLVGFLCLDIEGELSAKELVYSTSTPDDVAVLQCFINAVARDNVSRAYRYLFFKDVSQKFREIADKCGNMRVVVQFV